MHTGQQRSQSVELFWYDLPTPLCSLSVAGEKLCKHLFPVIERRGRDLRLCAFTEAQARPVSGAP
jgi:hypothetical protein